MMACLVGVIALGVASPGAITAKPYQFSVKATEAWKLLGRREYQRALSMSEAAVAENPRDPVALAVRGTAYQYVGEYVRAMADHDLVLQMTPSDPGALTNSCWVRAVAGVQLDLALTYCDGAVAKSRIRDFAAYDTRGFLHLKRGEFVLAVADYDMALSLRKKLASSIFGRGVAKLRLGKEAEGRADLAAATKLKPSIGDDYASQGIEP
jgi:tetratricopeptide (TPR) repeat protein